MCKCKIISNKKLIKLLEYIELISYCNYSLDSLLPLHSLFLPSFSLFYFILFLRHSLSLQPSLLQILYIVKHDPELQIVLTLFLNYRLVPRCPVFCGVGVWLQSFQHIKQTAYQLSFILRPPYCG